MFRNYFKVAVRNLSGNKVFSLINMLGLALEMGVCLLIYQYINFELSYDKFHINAENTYRITQTFTNREDLKPSVYTTYALGPRGKEMIPEIIDFVRIRPWEIEPVITNTENNETHQEDKVWSADSDFLQMFNFPLKYGDPESALQNKHSVVITEQMANKYFGNTFPIGKRLKVSLGITSGDFVVTGVLNKLLVNSHLQFDILLPLAFLLESHTFYRENDSNGWGLAALLSLGIPFLTLPLLNKIIGKEITFSMVLSPEFWIWFVLIVILGAVLSGLYPAFVLSSFKPVSVLKSNKTSGGRGFGLRKGLIVFQFLSSVLLISGTYLVYKQITFMKEQDLGVDMEKILVLNGPRVFLETLEKGEREGSKYRTFKNQATCHHAVTSVSASSSVPGRGYYYTEGFRRSGAPRDADKGVNIIIADTDFTDAYDLEFLAANHCPY